MVCVENRRIQSERLRIGPGTKPSEPGVAEPSSSDSMMLPSPTISLLSNFDTAELGEVLQLAANAVTTLADRLNALSLRVALISAVKEKSCSENCLEHCVTKLVLLVDSAAKQMRLIQKLLPVLQASALQSQPKK